MYNSETTLRAELPSSRKLMRSTILAALSAAVILVTVVQPAEYGIDPTGVGRVLRLTEMGQIKTRLAAEAAVETAGQKPAAEPSIAGITVSNPQPASPTFQTATPEATPVAAAAQPSSWRDEMSFTLKPGEGMEVKMRMKEGEKTVFAWAVEGGMVNYDTHGDSIGRSISYEKGRAVSSDDGDLIAAFTGNHGWYWRNRGEADVQLVLRTRGEYSAIKRVK
ncbi:transmembrane anchor protein [Rhodoferax sp.]|uniref:transmembrane anchor protein n=1 Tax=Rhodoferax sp. TaxID=50421 RepID=UPI002732F8F0|nr:transmembrane anchor protein [Rhodoferax sp.]MDP3190792.1 transmembrane anchor protein [Rhodoferax sp.]MDP3336561.1 transmembrane anchor protein [Rhodoferax sp.]